MCGRGGCVEGEGVWEGRVCDGRVCGRGGCVGGCGRGGCVGTWKQLDLRKSKQGNTTNLNISFSNEKRAAQVGLDPLHTACP